MSKFSGSSIWLFLLFGVGIILVLVIGSFIFSQSIGQEYANQIPLPEQVSEAELNQHTFNIRRISLNLVGSCETLELNRSGEAKQIECDDTYLENRRFLSNERIVRLFESLTQEEFINLESKYYDKTLRRDLIITIETNYGTKTITITNQDSTAPIITDELKDLVEEVEEIEEEVNQPDPTPLPLTTPTPTPIVIPTPTPGFTPLPSTSPQPTVSPDPEATPEPFRCDMLDELGVTVSNIRCVEEEDI